MARYDGSLIFDTKIDKKGFEKGVGGLKSAGAKAGKVIATGLATAGTAIVALGGYALKSSIEFESAFAGVKKVLDGTDEEFAMLEKGIRDLSKRLPQSAAEIAGVAEAAGQLGIKTADVLGFTETMVMLGDTTDLSSEEAATSLARLAAITGMSHKDFDRLGSTIVGLGNNFATTESEIVDMALRLAGTGNQVGLSEEQILGLSAAMSSVGINAEAGGSSFSRVMQKINTEVLSGGENLSKFAKISGMSAEDFSKKWKEEPEQAIVSFVEGLGKIKESGGDVTTALKEMGINSMQELDTLLRLSGASDNLSEALGISAEAWESNTALLDEAEQRYATTEAQIQILKNNITDLAITVGDELKSSLIDVIETSTEMVERLASAFEESGFSGLVDEMGAVLADIVIMIGEATPRLFEMATNMMMSFISGITENLPQIVESGFAIVNSLVNSIVEMLPMLLQLGIDLVVGLIEGIASGLPKMITVALDLVITLADKVIQNLPKIISAGLKLLEGLVKGIMDNLPKLIKEAPRIINDFANAIYKMLPKILLTGVKIILEIIKGLIKSIPTLVANIPQIIMAIVNVFTLYNFASVGKAAMTKLGGGIRSMVGNIASTARTLATNTINAIKGIFTQAPSIGSGFIRGVISGARSLGSSLAGIARSLGTRAISAIRGAFSGASSIGSNMVRGIWNGISSVTGWILSKISGFGSSIMKGIKGIFGIKSPSTVMRDQIGKNLALGLGVGIENEIPSLQRDIDGQMSKLTASMRNTVDIESSSIGSSVVSGNESLKYKVVSSVNDLMGGDGEPIMITDNNFYIREDADIEKVARKLKDLKDKKKRGR